MLKYRTIEKPSIIYNQFKDFLIELSDKLGRGGKSQLTIQSMEAELREYEFSTKYQLYALYNFSIKLYDLTQKSVNYNIKEQVYLTYLDLTLFSMNLLFERLQSSPLKDSRKNKTSLTKILRNTAINLGSSYIDKVDKQRLQLPSFDRDSLDRLFAYYDTQLSLSALGVDKIKILRRYLHIQLFNLFCELGDRSHDISKLVAIIHKANTTINRTLLSSVMQRDYTLIVEFIQWVEKYNETIILLMGKGNFKQKSDISKDLLNQSVEVLKIMQEVLNEADSKRIDLLKLHYGDGFYNTLVKNLSATIKRIKDVIDSTHRQESSSSMSFESSSDSSSSLSGYSSSSDSSSSSSSSSSSKAELHIQKSDDKPLDTKKITLPPHKQLLRDLEIAQREQKMQKQRDQQKYVDSIFSQLISAYDPGQYILNEEANKRYEELKSSTLQGERLMVRGFIKHAIQPHRIHPSLLFDVAYAYYKGNFGAPINRELAFKYFAWSSHNSFERSAKAYRMMAVIFKEKYQESGLQDYFIKASFYAKNGLEYVHHYEENSQQRQPLEQLIDELDAINQQNHASDLRFFNENQSNQQSVFFPSAKPPIAQSRQQEYCNPDVHSKKRTSTKGTANSKRTRINV